MWVERWNLCRLKCKNLFFVTSTWLWFMWLLFNSFCSWQMMPIWLYWNPVLWLSAAEVQHCDARVGSNCLARTCLNVANQRRGISTWCTNTSCPRDWGRTELCRILCCWQQVPCWARCSSKRSVTRCAWAAELPAGCSDFPVTHGALPRAEEMEASDFIMIFLNWLLDFVLTCLQNSVS